MAPLTRSTSRILANFALEGGLIFGVLYLLTAATVRSPLSTGSASLAQIAGLSLLLTACTYGTRHAGLAGRWGLEVILITVVSVFVGAVSFVTVWALSGSPRQLLGVLMLESAVAVPLAVAAWRWLALRWRVLAFYRERILIVGTGETARQVCRWIVENHAHEYAIVGFAAETDERMLEVLAMGSRIVTEYDALSTFSPGRVDRIIVALDEKRGKLPVKELVRVRLRGLVIEEATSFFERTSGKISVEMLLPSWLIYSEGFKTSRLRRVTKRAGDIALSSLMLAVSLPVMALVALAIRLESPGPVLYRQRRMGLEGREFDVLKFRSMYQDAERESGPTWATEDDPRITWVGWLLRKTRIDELPQLLNVLRGEMSFVGPRPERRHFVTQLEERIPFYALRMTVRPGVTGWAQVEYRYGASEEDAMEKLKYDLYYIKNCNPFLDLWIILKTVKVVLLGDGAR